MRRAVLLLLGFMAIVVSLPILVITAFFLWDAYYWWTAPALAKAYRTSRSEVVSSRSVAELEGLAAGEARQRAEAADFTCGPQESMLHCTRVIGDIVCSEEWYLVLEIQDERVSKSTATKRAICL